MYSKEQINVPKRVTLPILGILLSIAFLIGTSNSEYLFAAMEENKSGMMMENKSGMMMENKSGMMEK